MNAIAEKLHLLETVAPTGVVQAHAPVDAFVVLSMIEKRLPLE